MGFVVLTRPSGEALSLDALPSSRWAGSASFSGRRCSTSATWMLVQAGWLSLDGVTTKTWVVLLILGVLLGLGLSWSLIRARTTGQVEVQ
jgi:Family of unknown function (DUF6524)